MAKSTKTSEVKMFVGTEDVAKEEAKLKKEIAPKRKPKKSRKKSS